VRSLKYIVLIAAAVAMSGTATAQMRNPPPASINSMGGSHLGPPFASINSFPRQDFGFGFGCCPSRGHVRLTPGGRLFNPHGRRRGHHGPIFFPFPYPAFVPLYGGGYGYYGVAPPSDGLPGAGTFDRSGQPEAAEPEPGAAPIVFERRPRYETRAGREEEDRYGEHYLDERERRPEPEPGPAATPPAPPLPAERRPEVTVTTIIVFRDGRRAEIQNYAIMGRTLYLFSGERRKIPLADVDLQATVRENDDRGIAFHVPDGQ